MAGQIEARLKKLGIEVPKAASPAANYVPYVMSGSHIWISGQVPVWNGELKFIGQVGGDIDVDEGVLAARTCGLNIIAQAKAALGDLDRVARIVKLVGFVNGVPGFVSQPSIINGASDLMVEVFEEKGKHARSAVGAGGLPFNVAVEIEAVIEFGD
ncbi:RidA family protein [Alphaproteobacteria bacterium]|nr:RidA family protein [Alphaproteobacteria bacterium]